MDVGNHRKAIVVYQLSREKVLMLECDSETYLAEFGKHEKQNLRELLSDELC